uniref:Uncharacterized protein n=1 Tax=Apteryx owenii TaxID=8824 RepID=A0A8B9PRI8_APTOW
GSARRSPAPWRSGAAPPPTTISEPRIKKLEPVLLPELPLSRHN